MAEKPKNAPPEEFVDEADAPDNPVEEQEVLQHPTEAEISADTGADEPWGAQCLRRIHEDKCHLMRDYDDMLGPLEHDHVKGFMSKLLGHHDQHLTEIEKLWGKHYGHLPPLAEALGEEDLPEVSGDVELDEDENIRAEGNEDEEGAPEEETSEDEEKASKKPVNKEKKEKKEESQEDGPPKKPLKGEKAAPLIPRTNPADAAGRVGPRPQRSPATPQRVAAITQRKKSLAKEKPDQWTKCLTCGKEGCGCDAKSIGKIGHGRPCKPGERADTTGCRAKKPNSNKRPNMGKSIPGSDEWQEEEQQEAQHQEGVEGREELVEQEGAPQQTSDGLDWNDRDWALISETGGFLKDIGQPYSPWDDERRMKSYHYGKCIEGICQLDEAHAMVENNSTNKVPPANWTPGAGAKSVLNSKEKIAPVVAAMAPEVIGAVAGQAAASATQDKSHKLSSSSKFLKEIAFTKNFGDPHRQKALAFHKDFDEILAGREQPAEEEELLEEETPEEEALEEELPEELSDESTEGAESAEEEVTKPGEDPDEPTLDEAAEGTFAVGEMDTKSLKDLYSNQHTVLAELQKQLELLTV